MKALLKLIATFALTTTPALAVVACDNENKQISAKDILNAAAAFINDTNGNLKIKDDLALPDSTDIGAMEGKVFSKLDSTVQNAISIFFANKLKTSTDQVPTTWYYPDAHVKFSDIDENDPNINQAKFVLPTGSNLVNGHLLVTAEISYSNLPPITKNVMITLNNDKSNNQQKATAIKNFIASEISSDKLDVNVETLPLAGAVADNKDKKGKANTQLSIIQQNLNVAIKDKVQYKELKLGFAFNGDFSSPSTSTLFTMIAPTTIDNSLIFKGKINNIAITFLVGDGIDTLSTGAVSNEKTININQSFVDATTQITKIFLDRTIESVVSELPKTEETYEQYRNSNPTIEDEFIKNGYFADINEIYGYFKNDANWTEKMITITNTDSHFNLNSNNDNGYFKLNFKVSYQFPKTNLEFNITVENVHITLRKSKS